MFRLNSVILKIDSLIVTNYYLSELVINIIVIHKVRYTEIDWIAYMQVKYISV